MNTGFTIFYYSLTAILLALSFRKDRKKTNWAVRKAVFMMLGGAAQFFDHFAGYRSRFFCPAA